MARLIPPTYTEHLWTNDRFWGRWHLDRGWTLLVSGTTVTQVNYPWQGDLSNYDYVYLGGHEYDLSSAEATILTNAGYGAYIH